MQRVCGQQEISVSIIKEELPGLLRVSMKSGWENGRYPPILVLTGWEASIMALQIIIASHVIGMIVLDLIFQRNSPQILTERPI